MIRPLFAAGVAVPLLVIIAGCGHPRERAAATTDYSRIVSLSPSVTEILYALGLGDRVAGVTRFCKYPAEAMKKPKVGGFFDPNYEEIVRLRADLIIMLPEHASSRAIMENLGAAVLTVDHTNVSGILCSIRQIGDRCGVSKRAAELAGKIQERMDAVRKRTAALPRPRVMVSLGRGMASGSLDDLYIAGRGTLYDELIYMAGGVNVYQGKAGSFPHITLEGIYAMNPEIIIDMVPDLAAMNLTERKVRDEWDKAARVDAVKNCRVFLFEQDFVTIPGPRILETLEQMARAVHPEAAGE